MRKMTFSPRELDGRHSEVAITYVAQKSWSSEEEKERAREGKTGKKSRYEKLSFICRISASLSQASQAAEVLDWLSR